MGWEVAAQGTNLANLSATLENFELPKGTRMKVIFDLKAPVGFLFNAAGAEWLAGPFIPDGMDLVDVYGSGSKGIVEMESDPAWLLAVLAFMRAHWVALTLGTFALWLLISLITVTIKMPAILALPWMLIVGAAVGIVGLIALQGKRKAPS